jgi:hypothetical protein
MIRAALSAEQLAHYSSQGWILLDGVLEVPLEELQHEVTKISAWPDDGEWLHHFELTESGPKIARTENFTPFSPMMDALLRGKVLEIASELLGEPAALYKEKINYKLVGGAGFSPHQDKPAYPYVDQVLSVMIAVDDATIDNGCLYVVDAHHHEVLDQNERGCIREDIVEELSWHAVELRAGQTLFFHSLTPHRSGANNSLRDRRALYPTYNALSEGDKRDQYYATKRTALAQQIGGDRVALSLIGDFEGRPL